MNRAQFQWNGKTKYGTIRSASFDDEAKKLKQKGFLLIDDAVLPLCYEVPDDENVVKIPYVRPEWDRHTGEVIKGDDFDKHVAEQSRIANEKAASLPDDKLCVGHLFKIGVADGYANYVVTKVNKKTCKVEWRGFFCDDYHCQVLGIGGTFQKDRIWGLVKSGIGLAKLFAKKG